MPAETDEEQLSIMSTDDLDKLAGPEPANDKAPKAPPAAKRGPGRPKGSTTKPRTPAKKVDIPKRVTESVAAAGAGLAILGLTRDDLRMAWDGRLLAARAEELGEAVGELADSDPKIKAALERMFTVGTWGKFSASLAGIVLPIGMVHGLVPAALAAPFTPADMLDDEGRPTVAGRPVPIGKPAKRPAAKAPIRLVTDPAAGEASSG